jgi:DNA primase
VIEERSSAAASIAEQIYAANEVAQRVYREALASSAAQHARDYLKGRGLSEEDITHFEIGYAPDRWDTVVAGLKSEGISPEIGEQAGLLASKRGYYDRLRGRITFPIRDVRGRFIGFGGRAQADDQEPKYLNTPETAVFRKRETFYGFPGALAELRRANRAVICEGYFDRIALERAGVGEALATCGTALTAEHATQLSRRTAEVVLLFDGDDAGRQAMERSLEVLLPEGLRVRAAILPAGQDPDDYLVQRGAEALRELVTRSRDAVEEVIQRAVDVGCATPTQKADAVNRVVPLIALIADSVERLEYGRLLATWTATDESAVQGAIRAACGRGSRIPLVEPARLAPRRLSGGERHLHELAVLLFRHPALARRFDHRLLAALLPEGSSKAVIQALLDAEAAGRVDASGAADLFALLAADGQLDADAGARLRAAAVDDELFQDEPPERAIDAIVRSFERRHIDAKLKELTRRMADPEADHDAILREKDTFLQYKRKLKQDGLVLTRSGAGVADGGPSVTARGPEPAPPI